MKTNKVLPVVLLFIGTLTLQPFALAAAQNDETLDTPSYEHTANALANQEEEKTKTGLIESKEPEDKEALEENEDDTSVSNEPQLEAAQATGNTMKKIALKAENLTNLSATICRAPANGLAAIPCAAVDGVNLISRIIRFFAK